MKKMLTFMSIFLASLLLTGCVSIPLGDGGKLEVSKDGINVDLGEGSESEIDEVESAEEEKSEKEDEIIGEDAAEDDGGKDEGKSEATATGSASCDEFIEDPKGNDRLVKALAKLAPPNFPLADCTLMGTTREGYHSRYESVTVDADFKVKGYWADVYDEYVEYMEAAGFGPLAKREDAKDQYASLVGKTPDYDLTLTFKQRDAEDGTEFVSIGFGLYHYDTPRDE